MRPRLLFLRHWGGSNDNEVRVIYKEHQNTVIKVPTKLKAVTLRGSEVTIKKITETIVKGKLHVGKEYFNELDIAVLS